MMMKEDPLAWLGWNAAWRAAFELHAERGLLPARVVAEHQHIYGVNLGEIELLATVAGGLRHKAVDRSGFPVVGDWVAVKRAGEAERAVIQAILPRVSSFDRRAAGAAHVIQVVAANVDIAFLVSGLDPEFNPRRIERYLALAFESGARPVILLNKADLCDDVDEPLRITRAIAGDVAVHLVSCRDGRGLSEIASLLAPARTAALLGSSGVGKTSIINRLCGGGPAKERKTSEVRASDGRGRHSTTHRELIALPGGALLIDTPGLREIQLPDLPRGFDQVFDDINALAGGCRFRNCRHDTEPGCAVKDAAEAGTLPAGRLDSYRKLQGELDHFAKEADQRARLEEKRRTKSVHRLVRSQRLGK